DGRAARGDLPAAGGAGPSVGRATYTWSLRGSAGWRRGVGPTPVHGLSLSLRVNLGAAAGRHRRRARARQAESGNRVDGTGVLVRGALGRALQHGRARRVDPA